MSYVCVGGEWTAISNGAKVLIFCATDDREIRLELPAFRPPVKENKQATKAPKAEETNNIVLGMQFSNCGKFFAAYSSAKQLVIWDTSEWKLVSERYMPKTATSIKFTHDSQAVVIVDKAGDAVQFSVNELQKDGEIILGHLSMLLDVVLTPDGNKIITCDRDEKIRVSQFPNAYKIISYCLGHKEFVSSICLLAHKPWLLLSSSGDGTIRLWDYQEGRAVAVHNSSIEAEKELTADSSFLTQPESERANSVIVKKICCSKINDSTSLVGALIHGFQGCLVYRIVGEQLEFIQALCPNESVLDLCFRDSGELIMRIAKSESKIKCFMYDAANNTLTSSSISSCLIQCVSKINTILCSMEDMSISTCNVPQLLKRKFDNVKDYYEQKKARIGDQ